MSSETNRNRFIWKATSVAFLSLFGVVLSGCSFNSAIEKLHPYRMDVRQGNYVSQEMLFQLKPGMTRDQVRIIMGSPLLTDTFHQNRWDYVYRFAPGSGPVQQRNVALIFENDKLVRVEGDVVPATGEARGEAAAAPRVIDIDSTPAPKP